MNEKQCLSLMFDDAAEFREQLLGQTLRRVRRKRRIRQCGQVLALLALCASALWWSLPQRTTTEAPWVAISGLRVVHTQPLSADQIVRTRSDSVVMIATDPSHLLLVGDEELLALVPGKTKLLVWHAPDRAELVVIGP